MKPTEESAYTQLINQGVSKEIVSQMRKSKLIKKRDSEKIYEQIEPLQTKEIPRSRIECQELMGDSCRKMSKKSKS